MRWFGAVPLIALGKKTEKQPIYVGIPKKPQTTPKQNLVFKPFVENV